MRIVYSAAAMLVLLVVWVNVHYAHLTSTSAQPGAARVLRGESTAERAALKRAPMRRRSTASCEDQLRVLCIIPISPRSVDNPEQFKAELEMGTELAKLLLSPSGSGHTADRRCDSVRLYTSRGSDGVRTHSLDLGGGRHDPRAELVDLVLVHAADSYTNLWEKVYTSFAHAWAAGAEQRDAAESASMDAPALLPTKESSQRPAVAPLAPQLCASWDTLALELFSHTVDPAPCAEACQQLSDAFSVSHIAGQWGGLENRPAAIKWWLDAKCATDPVDARDDDDFDWYVKLDLDSVFVGENFRALACEARFDGDAPLALGHRATHRHFPMLLGAGYAINRAAMRRVMPRIMRLSVARRHTRDHAGIKCFTFATASEDAAFSKCLLAAGVRIPFTRDDEMGGEYFLPTSAGMARTHKRYPGAPDADAETMSWYWKGKNFSQWASPRHLEHCCAHRLVLAHGFKHGGAHKVLKLLYTLETMRRTQQPTRMALDTDLIIQAELAIWDRVDFDATDPRYATSIHFPRAKEF